MRLSDLGDVPSTLGLLARPTISMAGVSSGAAIQLAIAITDAELPMARRMSVSIWMTLAGSIVAATTLSGCSSETRPLTSGAGEAAESATDAHTRLALANVTASTPELKFMVPDDVQVMLKRKCFICHGGAETKGGFDFKQMVYKSDADSDWQPMDLAGVTRIKLAILPINGEPARMPRRAGSILNPLTPEEVNRIAGWTDYPFER